MFETLQFLGETNWQFISLQLTSSLPASSWGWPSSCVPALHINNVLQVILHLQQWHNDTICASQPQTFQFNFAASPFWLREGEGRGVTKRYWLCRWSLQMSCLSSMVSRIWESSASVKQLAQSSVTPLSHLGKIWVYVGMPKIWVCWGPTAFGRWILKHFYPPYMVIMLNKTAWIYVRRSAGKTGALASHLSVTQGHQKWPGVIRYLWLPISNPY